VVSLPPPADACIPPLKSHNHNLDISLYLTLSLSAADLATETGLDGGDGTTGTARVAGDEVQTVLSLVEFCVGTAAGFAGDVFDYLNYVSIRPLKKGEIQEIWQTYRYTV
jgi:hypothetical protein